MKPVTLLALCYHVESMIGTIRKHSTWLWIIIITVVIVTFVFWGSQTSRVDSGGGSGNYGTINERRITRDELAEAQQEVYLQLFLRSGSWPEFENERITYEMYNRLLLIRKQEELGIHVNIDVAARFALSIRERFGQANRFSLDQVLRQRGITDEDFGRFLRHDLGIQELLEVAGLGGQLVTPREVRAVYERENKEISAQAAFFSASNHLAEVKASPADIAQFYTNQMAAYRLPDRVQVTYVQFPASNFVAEAEQELSLTPNLNEILEAEFQRRGGTNFFRDAKSPEEAKQMIRNQEVKRMALISARKKAYEFDNEVYDVKPVQAENLEKLAAKKGFSTQVSEPFDRQFPPADLKVGTDFVRRAFGLTPDEPFAEPVLGEDAAFVIAFNKTLPSEVPSFEKIQTRVADDYRYSRAVMLARQAGSRFAAMCAAGIPNGKPFSAICADAKVRSVALPPFSISTRSVPEIEEYAQLPDFKRAAFSLKPGKNSDFQETADGGFVVFVQSELPLDETKMRAALPRYTEALRSMRENEAFNLWFNMERERGLRDTPMARRQPVPTGLPPQ
jgi:hypothetical protein